MAIEFNNYNIHFKITREDVEEAVRSLDPDVIRSLAVFVNGHWWPVKQPFVAACASKPGSNIKSNNDVNSRTAQRILARLFPTHDIRAQGPLPKAPEAPSPSGSPDDRRFALTLAAEVLKGRAVTGSDVTEMADDLSGWLAQR